MRITCSNGNAKNKISGSRIRVYTDNGELLGEVTVPMRNGKEYVKRWPNGIYGKQYQELVKKCEEIEEIGFSADEIAAMYEYDLQKKCEEIEKS